MSCRNECICCASYLHFLVVDLRELKETASESSKTDVCEALDCVRAKESKQIFKKALISMWLFVWVPDISVGRCRSLEYNQLYLYLPRVSSFRGPVLSSNAAPDMYLDRRLAAAFSPVDSSSLSSEGVYCFDSLDLCVGGLKFCRRSWMSI